MPGWRKKDFQERVLGNMVLAEFGAPRTSSSVGAPQSTSNSPIPAAAAAAAAAQPSAAATATSTTNNNANSNTYTANTNTNSGNGNGNNIYISQNHFNVTFTPGQGFSAPTMAGASANGATGPVAGGVGSKDSAVVGVSGNGSAFHGSALSSSYDTSSSNLGVLGLGLTTTSTTGMGMNNMGIMSHMGVLGSMNSNAMPFVPQQQFGQRQQQQQQVQAPSSGQTITLDELVPITTSTFLQVDMDAWEPEWYRLSCIEITGDMNCDEADRRMYGPSKRKRKRKKKRNRRSSNANAGLNGGEGDADDADGSDGEDDDDAHAGAGGKDMVNNLNQNTNNDASDVAAKKVDQFHFTSQSQQTGVGAMNSLGERKSACVTPVSVGSGSKNTTPKPHFVDFVNHFTPKSAAPVIKPVSVNITPVMTPGVTPKAAVPQPGVSASSGSATTMQQASASSSSSTSSSSNSLVGTSKE